MLFAVVFLVCCKDTTVYEVRFHSHDEVMTVLAAGGGRVTAPAVHAGAGEEFDGWYLDSSFTSPYDFTQYVRHSFDVYAKWKSAGVHMISFVVDPQGKLPAAPPPVAPMSVSEGERPVLPVPVAYRHEFAGWYEDEACTKRWAAGEPVKKAMTLYGGWRRIYDVRLNVLLDELSHGSGKREVWRTLHVAEGGIPYIDECYSPTERYVDFRHWYVDEACTKLYEFGKHPMTGDLDLYSGFKRRSHEVVFDRNRASMVLAFGETPPSDTTKRIAEGEKVPQEPQSSFSKCWFGGWYEDEACTKPYDFNRPVMGPLHLYARWRTDLCTVRFHRNENSMEKVKKLDSGRPSHGDGGTVNPGMDSLESSVGLLGDRPVARPADPKSDWYAFKGWYTTAACEDGAEYDFSKHVMDDTTLYAKWERKIWTVRFDVNGNGRIKPAKRDVAAGEPKPPSSVQVKAGDHVPLRTLPRLTYHVFKAWYPTEACVAPYDSLGEPVERDMILYAGWESRDAQMAFRMNIPASELKPGTAIPDDQVRPLVPGQALVKPVSPDIPWYEFKGWYSSPACKPGEAWDFSMPMEEPMDLYAKWERRVFTVTYDPNPFGCPGYDMAKDRLHPDDRWVDDVTAALTDGRPRTVAVPAGAPFEDRSLTSKWYTQYRAGGSGWYGSPKCESSSLVAAGAPVEKDMTVYACWSAAGSHSVTYDLNLSSMPARGAGEDALAAPAAQKVAKGGVATCPAQADSPWYVFKGWHADRGGASPYDFSSKVEGDVTLYAKWERRVFTVTYDPNPFGCPGYDMAKDRLHPDDRWVDDVTAALTDGRPRTVAVPAGAPFEDRSLTSKWYTHHVGANGGHWYMEDPRAENWKVSNMAPGVLVEKDMTVYAVWDVKKYTVTYDPNPFGCSGWDMARDRLHPDDRWVDDVRVALTDGRPRTVTVPAGTPFEDRSLTSRWYTQYRGSGSGWYGSPKCEAWELMAAGVPVEKDMTVYTCWKAKEYRVTYDPNPFGDPSCSMDRKRVHPADKWVGDVSVALSDGKPRSVTVSAGTPFEDRLITSKWYVHHVGAHGGHWYLEDPECDARNNISPGTRVEKDMTVYAAWDAKKYTVTYDPNPFGCPGYDMAKVRLHPDDRWVDDARAALTDGRPRTVTVPAGTPFEDRSLTSKWYTQYRAGGSGWYGSPKCESSSLVAAGAPVEKDMTVYACWEPVRINVTYTPTLQGYRQGFWSTGGPAHKGEYDIPLQQIHQLTTKELYIDDKKNLWDGRPRTIQVPAGSLFEDRTKNFSYASYQGMYYIYWRIVNRYSDATHWYFDAECTYANRVLKTFRVTEDVQVFCWWDEYDPDD